MVSGRAEAPQGHIDTPGRGMAVTHTNVHEPWPSTPISESTLSTIAGRFPLNVKTLSVFQFPKGTISQSLRVSFQPGTTLKSVPTEAQPQEVTEAVPASLGLGPSIPHSPAHLGTETVGRSHSLWVILGPRALAPGLHPTSGAFLHVHGAESHPGHRIAQLGSERTTGETALKTKRLTGVFLFRHLHTTILVNTLCEFKV